MGACGQITSKETRKLQTISVDVDYSSHEGDYGAWKTGNVKNQSVESASRGTQR